MSDEQLREAVARAICHDNVNGGCPCQHGFKCLSSLWDTAADAAIAIVLEEAAKLAETKADEWATAWRNRFKVDSHMEGKSDGADEIAAAIRALISTRKDIND